MSQPPRQIVIIGAGLAGLACAVRLHEAGVHPQVFEASDDFGGRVRTDRLDGFLLDRGFQVFLDAYPEAGKLLDLPKLDLHRFKPGALLYQDSGPCRVMDVFRSPRHLVGSALAPIGTLADKLRVAALRWKITHRSLPEIEQQEDMDTAAYLTRAGFTPAMIDGFFRSFYGGIFLERELSTSSRMFEFTFKMFSEGSATLPAQGMGEIPRQLAARLPPAALHLNQRVAHIQPHGITLASGKFIAADAVVVATDAASAAHLAPAPSHPERSWRSVTCLYFAASKSPLNEAIIALNGSGTGLINNVCVPSDVAPSYAPPGQALLSVSVLGTPDTTDLEARVRAELETWFGPAARSWRHLRTYSIPHALPTQAPAKLPRQSLFRQENGTYFCGDHLSTASIEGAIRSGLDTAAALLRTTAS